RAASTSRCWWASRHRLSPSAATAAGSMSVTSPAASIAPRRRTGWRALSCGLRAEGLAAHRPGRPAPAGLFHLTLVPLRLPEGADRNPAALRPALELPLLAREVVSRTRLHRDARKEERVLRVVQR